MIRMRWPRQVLGLPTGAVLAPVLLALILVLSRWVPQPSEASRKLLGSKSVLERASLIEEDERPIEFWLEELHNPEAHFRQRAAAELEKAVGKQAAVIPALVGALMDKDPGVRQFAACALERLERADPAVRHALVMKLGDGSRLVRIQAALDLKKLGAGDRRVVAALADAVKDTDADVRRLAIQALGRQGAAAKSALAALRAALTDREEAVRHEAANVLEKLDRPADANAEASEPRKTPDPG
jgi:HEAT repeat protein